MIKAFFELVDEVKFVVVIPATIFESLEIEQVASPFIGFLNMFNFEGLDEPIRSEMIEKVLSSLTILVSRSKSPAEEYKENMEGILEGLPESKVKHKELIAKILKHIMEEDKLSLFKAAKYQQSAEPNTLSKKFESDPEGKWNFLDLKEI